MAYFVPTQDQLKPLKEGKKLIIWVLGGPGSGKGTQCEKIANQYQFTHISTGDLLREESKGNSEKSKALQDIMKEGALVPMNVVLSLLTEKMLASYETSNGFLLDGYPREITQALAFETQICKCDILLYMHAEDKILISRLLKRAETSGRPDDNEKTITKRLKTFHEHNDPIVETYHKKAVMIQSDKTPEEVYEQCVVAIDTVLNRRNRAAEEVKEKQKS